MGVRVGVGGVAGVRVGVGVGVGEGVGTNVGVVASVGVSVAIGVGNAVRVGVTGWGGGVVFPCARRNEQRKDGGGRQHQ